MSKIHVSILGLGAYLPPKVLSNFDLEKMVDTTDEWIQTRTGIKERRIVEKGVAASDLGAEAAKKALQNAKLNASDLDLIVVATATPDMTFPSTGCLIQKKIGASCPAFDLSAACSGFVYAVSVAEAYIQAGIYKKVLVVGSEITSSFINWKDRSTCVLFGDGAGAAILGANGSDRKLLASYIGSDGNYGDILKVPAGGSAIPISKEAVEQGLHFLKMEGADVFKLAVRTMGDAVFKVCESAGIKTNQIACLIPHQANLRILNAVAERIKIPEEKVFINVDRYGNMSAASTIVALYEAAESGKLKKGDYVVLVAFGGGLTWGSCAIEW